MEEKNRRLGFAIGENALLEALGLKHGTVECAAENIAFVYSNRDLNRVVGQLAVEDKIDLGELHTVAFVSRVGEGMARDYAEIAALVREYATPPELNLGRFEVCLDCSTDYGMKAGHFSYVWSLPSDTFFSFAEAFGAMVRHFRGDLTEKDVGQAVALLKQVLELEADFPMETPPRPEPSRSRVGLVVFLGRG